MSQMKISHSKNDLKIIIKVIQNCCDKKICRRFEFKSVFVVVVVCLNGQVLL